jgi:hypothetical protein
MAHVTVGAVCGERQARAIGPGDDLLCVCRRRARVVGTPVSRAADR